MHAEYLFPVIYLGIHLFSVCFLLGVQIWERFVQPMSIPKREIEARADALVARCGKHAVAYARFAERRAARRCDFAARGRWRRVRRELVRRSRR